MTLRVRRPTLDAHAGLAGTLAVGDETPDQRDSVYAPFLIEKMGIVNCTRVVLVECQRQVPYIPEDDGALGRLRTDLQFEVARSPDKSQLPRKQISRVGRSGAAFRPVPEAKTSKMLD